MARLALIALASCALSSHALACGRSELLVPDAGGSPGDDAPGDQDASVASETGVASEAGVDVGAAGDDAALEVEAPEDEGGFFSNPPPDAGPSAAADGGGCGPSSCGGCCDGNFCRFGLGVLTCGTGGQACVTCGPELSCPRGVCQ
jgi:hypothetical protein